MKPFSLSKLACGINLLSLLSTCIAAQDSSKQDSALVGREFGKRAGIPKAVFAHIVQGNFQSYQAADWEADIALAKAAGIDAFALNVGGDPTDPAEMALAFAAAEKDGTFKMFFSFDMGYFHTAGSAQKILDNYILKYGPSTGHYKVGTQILVTTFSGETSTTFLDGTSSMSSSVQAWQSLISKAKANSPSVDMYFVPDWNDPSLIDQDVFSGIMSWGAWPTGGEDMTTANDQAYLTKAKAKSLSYIAPVSAFFSVHDFANNNYIWRGELLLPQHYTQLINMSPGPDFIELLTWNDYGEGHYLGPVRANAGLPGAAADYVNKDFDHTPMLTLSSYYNQWFKTGTAPTIKSEVVVWWYRPHPKAAQASGDPFGQPKNTDWTDDKMYAVALLPAGTKATSVIFTTGGKAQAGQAVKAGVNLLSVPFSAGDTGIALVDAAGNNVIPKATGSAIEASPTKYNFNYHCYILPSGAGPASIFSGSPASVSSSGATGTQSATGNPTSTGTATTSSAVTRTSVSRTATSKASSGAATATSIRVPTTTGSGSASPTSDADNSGDGNSNVDTKSGANLDSTTQASPTGLGSASSLAASSSSSPGGGTTTSSSGSGEGVSPAGPLGVPIWVWCLIIIIIPLAGIGIFILMRRRKKGEGGQRSDESDSEKGKYTEAGTDSDSDESSDDDSDSDRGSHGRNPRK